MMSDRTGIIFDIKRFAVHDGPGIRTTVFFKGCPLRCWWCHNPEGISPSKQFSFFQVLCINCGRCIEICPGDAIEDPEKGLARNTELCVLCERCIEVCPTTARKMIGRKIDVDEVMTEIQKDIMYFDASDGGVTISGGEPLMQPEFLRGILEACRSAGIHTTIDTTGYSPPKVFESLMDLIDLYLYDIKLLDDDMHRRYTGVSNRHILDNLRTSINEGKHVILRFSLIPGITDTKKNIEDLVRFLPSVSGVDEIHLLPFHNVHEKYQRLGEECRMMTVGPPASERLASIREELERTGIRVKIGG